VRPGLLADANRRWTGDPPHRYDRRVDPLTPPKRHVRPTSTIRGALGAGFAVVFGLWVLSGYELIRSLGEVERRVTEMQESFARGVAARATVRTNVLLGSIYLRDALIDSGEISRDYYRREIQHIRGEIERLLPTHLIEVEIEIEREHWSDLQEKLQAYWTSLEVVFSPDLPENTAQAAAMLRRHVVPARRDVLAVVDNLSALQQLSQQRQQVEASLLFPEVRNRFLRNVSGAILIGMVVACFAFLHVGRLEREIHRQRLAEAHNRHDLERLSARLVDVQEDERRNLARELHDEVGQALTAMKMEIGVALRSGALDARSRASLDEARAIAETTLQGVRDLSQLLHPSMLDDFGLPEALAAYLRGMSKRTGIRAHLTHAGLDGRLPADVEVSVYRIVQEALTNVARHSGARTCNVAIARADGSLRLVIEDDGCGLHARTGPGGRETIGTTGETSAQRGLGLIGMRERAQALAGRFVIENRAEGGTRVVVTLPVADAPSSDAAPRRVAV
jgi:signal transduction histidine kinase